MKSYLRGRSVYCGASLCMIAITAGLSISCSRTSSASATNGSAADASANLVTVGVAKVAKRDLSEDLVLTAEFRPFQEIDVHAKVAGYVKDIFVDVGDRVWEGQALANLEIPELQADVAEAAAAQRRSEAEIRRAQDELERAQSAQETIHLAYTRLLSVSSARPKLIAQQDLDDARGRDLVAQAQVNGAKEALAGAQQEMEVAKAALDKTQTMASYAEITSPFSGVITKRYADTGAMIQAGTNSSTQAMPVVRLAQNDVLRLIIPVPESSVPRIRLGMPVQVQVPSLGKAYNGTVARFADRIDAATRTMDTQIDVPNPKFELIPGMYASATIRLEERKEVLAIPVQALSQQNGHTTVFRMAGNTVEQQPIELGLEAPDYVEILSGLRENDSVVVTGRSQIRSGMKVNARPVELNSEREGS